MTVRDVQLFGDFYISILSVTFQVSVPSRVAGTEPEICTIFPENLKCTIFPKSTSYTILYSLIFIWNIPLDKILYSLSMHVSKKYMWAFKGHQKCMLLEFTTGEFERTPHWKKFQLCMHTDNIREYFLRRNNLDPQ